MAGGKRSIKETVTDYYQLDDIKLPSLLYIDEVAALLDISSQTVRRLVDRKAIPTTSDGFITEKDLRDFLVSNEAVNLPVQDLSQCNNQEDYMSKDYPESWENEEDEFEEESIDEEPMGLLFGPDIEEND